MAEEIRKIVTIDTEGSEQTVAGLRKEMSELRDVILNTTKGTEQYDAATKQLQADQQTLNSVMSVSKTGMAALKDELKQAKDVMASAAKGTDEYAAAAKRAAEASAKLRDMQEEVRYGDTGLDGQFEITTKTLGNLAGGFQAAQGAMALFGVENEDLEKRFVKLQAAMSLTGGLKSLASLPKSLNAAKVAFSGLNNGVKAFNISLKGVKGAIAATGLGVFLVLLGELINHWDDVKAATERFSGTLDRVKEVLAGVGNVVKNLVMGPLKALGQAFELDFKGAWETIKQSFSIKANFETGANAQSVKNTENAERKKQAAAHKTTEEYIKDMEAQKGADWKYTKEGQESYKKMFDARLAMYKKDSKEYKEAQRDKWEYEHQLEEKKKKSGGSSKKGKTPEQEEEEAREAAEKLREEIAELRTEAQNNIEDVLAKESKKRFQEFREEVAKLTPVLKEAFSNEPLLEWNRTLTRNATDAIFEFRNKIAKAGIFSQNEMDTFMEGILSKNMEAIRPLLERIKKDAGFSKADFIELTEEIKIFMYGEEAALQVYLDALENEDEELLATYAKMFDISHNEGYLLYSDLATFGNAFVKLKKQYDAYSEFVKREDVQEMKRLENQTYARMNITAEWDNKMANIFRGANLRNNTWWEDFFQLPKPTDLTNAETELTKVIIEFYQKSTEEAKPKVAGLLEDIFGYFYNNDFSKKVNPLAAMLDFSPEESLKDLDQEIAYNTHLMAIETDRMNNKIDLLREEQKIYEEGSQERKAIAEEISKLEQEKTKLTTDTISKNTAIQIEKYKLVAKTIQSIYPNTVNLFGSLSDYLANLADSNEKTNYATAKKQFETSKTLAKAETWMQTIATVQGIIKSYSGTGPWGIAAGAIAAAAALASGLARVQQINNQKFGDEGSSSTSVSTGTAVPIPNIGQDLPYDYVRNYTTGEDEDEYNKRPIIVQVSDISDALKQEESRKTEVSF